MTPEQSICITCQECCKWVTFTVVVPQEEYDYYTSFYKARGCLLPITPTPDSEMNLVVMVPSVCPELTDKGCSIYDTRPAACRDYDGRNDILMCQICLLPKEEDDD